MDKTLLLSLMFIIYPIVFWYLWYTRPIKIVMSDVSVMFYKKGDWIYFGSHSNKEFKILFIDHKTNAIWIRKTIVRLKRR